MPLFPRQWFSFSIGKAPLLLQRIRLMHLKGKKTVGNANNSFSRVDITGDVRRLYNQSRLKDALHILYTMDQPYIQPDCSTYASLLEGCGNMNCLPAVKLVHAHIIHTGFSSDISLETKLIIMYTKCGSLIDGRRVFDKMTKRNVISWTAMIGAHSRSGQDEEALALFCEMQRTGIQPNQFTFATVLPVCAKLAALEHGKEVHEHIIRSGFQFDVFVATAVVDMYVKCGRIDDARKVFDKIPERDVVLWTTMIAAYSRHGFDEEALKLIYQMHQAGAKSDQFTFASALSACANLAALKQGKEVHGDIIRSGFQTDVCVDSALVDMYVKCGRIQDASQVFDKMLERDVFSWTSMIGGYAQRGHVDQGLKLFEKMPERSVVSWNAMIVGYAQNKHVGAAQQLFQKMPERDVVSWNAMVTGYAQNGHVDKALEIFQKMPEQNVVSWNTMIAGYEQNRHFNETLKLFRKMRLRGVEPNAVTFMVVLPACASLTALEHGKEVHEDIIRSGFQYDVFVENALVDMYAKCGGILDAEKLFDRMPKRDVVSWTAMIVGYAMHGCGKEALCLFEQMQHCGITPNHATFVGVLSACCHTGLVDDGWQYFNCMSQDYHITPAAKHYCCMVDLLGRAGRLDEAQHFINQMPIKPDVAVWGSLLGACRNQANLELGERVAEHLFELDPKNAAHYVLLSNIYAEAGKWDDVERVRNMMKDRRVKKMPGCSWIEVHNKMHAFLVGNISRP